MVSYLICYIFVSLLYIERKRLLMRNLATILKSGKFQRFNVIDRSIEMLENSLILKISIRMKNCKLFCKAKTAVYPKEIIQSPPIPLPTR